MSLAQSMNNFTITNTATATTNYYSPGLSMSWSPNSVYIDLDFEREPRITPSMEALLIVVENEMERNTIKD